MSSKEKTKMEEKVKSLNEKGLRIWEGVVITCAETGEYVNVEVVGEPGIAHAFVGEDGNVYYYASRTPLSKEGVTVH